MKKVLIALLLSLLTVTLYTQAPDLMSYQAVVRDADGMLVTNEEIGIKISILQGSDLAVIYSETHTTTSNSNGLVTIQIGSGIIVSGDIEFLSWSDGPFFLRREIDPEGGSNYSISGEHQLLSVPYALYSKTVDGTHYPPRMSTQERNQLASPTDGMFIFNTTSGCPNYFFNLSWHEWCGTGILPIGTIDSLHCNEAMISGTLIEGQNSLGVFIELPYSIGNGGTFPSDTVSSSGVTGLIATLEEGVLEIGTGVFEFQITGTPDTSGTTSFVLGIGSQTCSIEITVDTIGVGSYHPGTVHCDPDNPTEVVEVLNPVTGKIWMDRNLGASQVATSSTDVASYGDLYQWGRFSDGHQCRDSEIINTQATTAEPFQSNVWDGNFINGFNNWLNENNVDLWQGVNGVNNPCPEGYRLPTETELNAELLSWTSNNASGAFSSPLKLPMAGYRNVHNGLLLNVGTGGDYWSSTVSSTLSRYLFFISTDAGILTSTSRAYGGSIRCIKD